MRFKRLLSLLLAAALALSLLAGCGGGKALSQVIVDLLDNLYSNVSVEADSDLTAALKQAAAEGGTEEEILSRMIEILNHKGGSITFTRLGSGQQGDHAVTLYFQTGTDPDAAARNALAQWAGTLGTLPDDGSYQADVAMIETENGYYIALDVEVLKAGKPDKPDKPDSGPTLGPTDVGFANDDYSVEWADEANGQKLFKVKTGTGLVAWADYVRDGNWNTNCTLEDNVDLADTGNWEPIGNNTVPYTGTFDGNGKTVTGLAINNSSENEDVSNVGMFAYNEGIVKDLTLNGAVTNAAQIDSVGMVAGKNGGTITGCSVSGTVSNELISGSTGGVVGLNYGTITDCSMENGSVTSTGARSIVGGLIGVNSGPGVDNCHVSNVTVQGNITGGLAGENTSSNRIAGCWVENGSVTGTSAGAGAGGVVGSNGGEIIACYHINGSVSSSSSGKAGGVVGTNNINGKLTACYHSGSNISGHSGLTGGVAGSNNQLGKITACYWSGYTGNGTGILSTKGDTTQITEENAETTWNELVTAMADNGYTLEGSYPNPTGLAPIG